MKLDGKVALVTGAGRGIGRRIAHRLSEEGAGVVFNDREADPSMIRDIDARAEAGHKVIFHSADVSQVDQIKAMIDRTLKEFGRLDILVNNAAIDPTAPFLDVTEQQWHEVISTNFKGTFFCSQLAAREMRKVGQGRIINISSVHGQATMAGYSVYAATKSAVDGLTRELALELAPERITVNAVAPGAIEVEKFVSSPLYDRDALAREIPLGRVGRPEDISGIVAFLCSEEAGWLTGQVITVDGGTLTRLYLYAGRPVPVAAEKH